MFKLVVMPDGHAILTSEADMPPDTQRLIVEAFRRWRESPAGDTLIMRAEVVKVLDVELDVAVAGE